MKTLAVVIGNNNYYENAKLENAVNDANAIAEVFGRLGYDLIHKTDCGINDYISLLQEFDERIKDYDATIFYFAGHGFQLDGENYLTSIECQVSTPNKYHCSRTCITLTEVLDILKRNSNKINVVIIDACRKSFERGGDTAFTPIQAPKGTLIAFSTSPNEGAKDHGLNGHSIYTGALLKYIGRERLSIEELFKKVRKTVYNLSEGKQTTWEHTSLIGDFFFNTGQLVHTLNIPYDVSVVKDRNFKNRGGSFDNLIFEVKSLNWDRQNPAINDLLQLQVHSLNKNQQFILGRNILQANTYAHNASYFFRNLKHNLSKYSYNGENHVLNGILFEIYFDSNGDFRQGTFKTHSFEEIMSLRGDVFFEASFEFLRGILEPSRDLLYWFPDKDDVIIDVDVLATSENVTNHLGNTTTWQVISKINVFSKEIIENMRRYSIAGMDELGLKDSLVNFLTAPKELIQINSNIQLDNIALTVKEDEFEFGRF